MLDKVHHWRNVTHHYQDLTGNAETRYYGWADQARCHRDCRNNIRILWYHRAVKWYTLWKHIGTAVSVTGNAVPSWAITAFNCISNFEEYGVTGTNTSAGYFGMVYSPSAYPSPGPEFAQQYGDSWMNIPLSAQYQIAYAEYQKYGWSPWTTAYHCT